MGRLTGHAAVLAATAALLAGCSGDRDPDDAQSSATLGSLDALVEVGAPRTAHESAARQMAAEQAVAACMAAKGFEYVPFRLGHTLFEEVGPPRGSREFADEYGYSMVKQVPDRGVESVSGDSADPNAAIVATLSPEARAAYELALDGDGADRDFRPGDVIDTDVFGCRAAEADVMVNGAGRSDPVFVDLLAYMHHIDDVLLAQDERIAALDATWSACMSDRGWPGFTRQTQARDLALSWVLALRDESLDDPVFANGTHFENERELALADWECSNEIDYDEASTAVRTTLQDDYVAEHREELENWLLAWHPDTDLP